MDVDLKEHPTAEPKRRESTLNDEQQRSEGEAKKHTSGRQEISIVRREVRRYGRMENRVKDRHSVTS
jgi:hypothetical protein